MIEAYESSEAFTAHATIGAGYYMIGELQKELIKPKAPIVRMVDAATGYEDVRQKEIADQLIVCLVDIIAAKKVIEADYTSDEQMLGKTKEFIKTLNIKA